MVGLGIFFSGYMSNGDSFELSRDHVNQGQVGHHVVFAGFVLLQYLVYNQLGVTVNMNLLGAQRCCQLQPDQEGFILGLVVRGFESEPKGVL